MSADCFVLTDMRKQKQSPIEEFIALPPERKEQEFRSIDRAFARSETSPLSVANRAAWQEFRRRRGSRKRAQ